MRKILLILVLLIGLGIIFNFILTLWKDLSIYPFDKISLTNQRSSTYFKDRFGNFYYGFQTLMMQYKKLNVDKGSFKVIDGKYAKDRYQVLFGQDIIKNADVLSFKTIPNNYSYVLNQQHLYEEIDDLNKLYDGEKDGDFALDKNHIYFNGYRVVNNKYKEIRNFATNIVVADSDIIVGNINFSSIVISYPTLDTSTFRPYTKEFWADNNFVYCYSANTNKFYPLKNINRSRFRYYKTKKENQFSHVFGDENVFYTYSGDCVQTSLD